MNYDKFRLIETPDVTRTCISIVEEKMKKGDSN